MGCFIHAANFNWNFDKDSRQYKCGEKVQCSLEVVVLKKFKAFSFAFRFLGKAHYQIDSDEKSSDDEEFFRYYDFFFKHSDAQEILPGTYRYQSSFTLPSDLPTS